MSERTETVNPQVFQAILLNKIYKELKGVNRRLSVVESRGIPFEGSAQHQRATIQPGYKATVYSYEIGGPYVGYLKYVGCQWYPDTYYDWEIDGVRRERVQRMIGNPRAPMSEPQHLEKPIIVHDRVRWIGYNNDTVAHVFEVFEDGILYPLGTDRYIGGIG